MCSRPWTPSGRAPRGAQAAIWDNAPPHHPHRVRDTAPAAGITLAFLPFRSPELMPLEDLWRGLKQTVAANRCYPSLAELTHRALAWLEDMTPADRLRRCGFETSKFDWLPMIDRGPGRRLAGRTGRAPAVGQRVTGLEGERKAFAVDGAREIDRACTGDHGPAAAGGS